MILVDSNIWAYALDASAREHPRVASRLPELLEQTLVMPAIVQLEVVHYLARRSPSPEGPTQAFLALDATVEPLGPTEVAEAARMLARHAKEGIGGRDAHLVAVAARLGATIATHDKALARVCAKVGVATVDPAKP